MIASAAACSGALVVSDIRPLGRSKVVKRPPASSMIGMSAATEAEGQIVHCPECGGEMVGRGKRKRQLQGAGGSEVELERVYLECPACGAGFFPSG